MHIIPISSQRTKPGKTGVVGDSTVLDNVTGQPVDSIIGVGLVVHGIMDLILARNGIVVVMAKGTVTGRLEVRNN